MMFQIKPASRTVSRFRYIPEYREPAERQPEEPDKQQSEEEVREGRDHDEDRRQDAIERTARRHAQRRPTWSDKKAEDCADTTSPSDHGRAWAMT